MQLSHSAEPECKPKLPVTTSAEAEGGRSRISVYVPTNEVNIIPDNKKKLKNVDEIFLNYTKLRFTGVSIQIHKISPQVPT